MSTLRSSGRSGPFPRGVSRHETEAPSPWWTPTEIGPSYFSGAETGQVIDARRTLVPAAARVTGSRCGLP